MVETTRCVVEWVFHDPLFPYTILTYFIVCILLYYCIRFCIRECSSRYIFCWISCWGVCAEGIMLHPRNDVRFMEFLRNFTIFKTKEGKNLAICNRSHLQLPSTMWTKMTANNEVGHVVYGWPYSVNYISKCTFSPFDSTPGLCNFSISGCNQHIWVIQICSVNIIQILLLFCLW